MIVCDRVKRVLSDSKSEVEELLKSYTSSDKLATYAIALKRYEHVICVYLYIFV